jgi:holo-[acyl-carrier protein] synthase
MKVGIDLTRISRFENKKENFINRILTKVELEEFNKLKDDSKSTFLAVRWACKEAIFKATQDQKYLEYSILKHPSGEPYVLDHPEMSISISHEGDYVTSIVIVEK